MPVHSPISIRDWRPIRQLIAIASCPRSEHRPWTLRVNIEQLLREERETKEGRESSFSSFVGSTWNLPVIPRCGGTHSRNHHLFSISSFFVSSRPALSSMGEGTIKDRSLEGPCNH
ncbi:hypothetical protein AVEN_95529-1 [Araneus ventricosus]|uniref:Uncharacterized protein n=1 Tax=Araneus ventricosus TaxID=182803 RepID=A0A4Y2HEK4_ARAVE|nr:hypothetical protein AVEN_95529-1 [Araneus ventricosus]